MIDHFALSGRVAVVTGASKGLGLAMARGLASAGADVMLVARNHDELARNSRAIASEFSVRSVFVATDVGTTDAGKQVVDRTMGNLDRLDILVNCAGIIPRGALQSAQDENYQTGMNVNVFGTWSMCRAAIPAMRLQGGGSIINVASVAGMLGMNERSVYSTSKGAVIQLTKALAVELAPFGIRVNAISPGPFATEGTQESRKSARWDAMIEHRIPLRRTADPSELGGAAIFLASSASSFVTGVNLPVDGGWTAS